MSQVEGGTAVRVPGSLNARASAWVDVLLDDPAEFRASVVKLDSGARVIDVGVKQEGGLDAGLILARICLAGLGDVSLVPADCGGLSGPHVQVATDHPVAACLYSQYAGWQLAAGKFFGMGSGPMRAVAAREELFSKLGFRESSAECVGVLETGKLPDDDVVSIIAEKTGVPAKKVVLVAARTASQAGNVQVVARSVETALHKLLELGFDVSRIRSGFGIAPLPPVAADDLIGIGRTNDAILYGGRVTLWVTGDDESIAAIGPRVPADSSPVYGKPFLEIFEAAGRDFYKIDPHLFSPAEITFQNLQTGRAQRFGRTNAEVLRRSYLV